jgi:hypothetical protein
MKTTQQKIKELAIRYSTQLGEKTDARMKEMRLDDNAHYLIYQVLGVVPEEGELIDLYQNKGRFLYKYAGSFLEEAAIRCFTDKFTSANAKKIKIPNTIGTRPKTFEIDCLVNNTFAYEIKWRDATTDGDLITKEHTRIQVIKEAGYQPIRLMFYYPNRAQAIRIQQTIETLYTGISGKYYYGYSAWNHIAEVTDVDLLGILQVIADEKLKGR